MTPTDFVAQFTGLLAIPTRGGENRTMRIKYGTAAENAEFIGHLNELTFSTDDKTLHLHDGETAGGVLHWKLM